MGPLGANINKYQRSPAKSSDEHFLNYFSFFFYKKSNDFFFNFYKVWVGELEVDEKVFPSRLFRWLLLVDR